MGIASMVLGIVSLAVGITIGFFPFCGSWVVIPALVGLILGIVSLVSKKIRAQQMKSGIVGVILNSIAIVAIIALQLFIFSNMELQPIGVFQQQPGFGQGGFVSPPSGGFGHGFQQGGGGAGPFGGPSLTPMEPMEKEEPPKPEEAEQEPSTNRAEQLPPSNSQPL